MQFDSNEEHTKKNMIFSDKVENEEQPQQINNNEHVQPLVSTSK
jgi:hypothetical protein